MSNVFITGASSGIGAALARQYAQRGDVLGLVARNPEKLQALIDTLPGDKSRYHAIPADVTKKDEIIAAAQKFEALSGGADIVIANAGTKGLRQSGTGEACGRRTPQAHRPHRHVSS